MECYNQIFAKLLIIKSLQNSVRKNMPKIVTTESCMIDRNVIFLHLK